VCGDGDMVVEDISMKVTQIRFEPTATIKFSAKEKALLIRAAKRHYDGTIRAATQPGRDSFIYGMKNGLDYFTSREVDLLCKVAESPLEGVAALWFPLVRILKQMHTAAEKANERYSVESVEELELGKSHA
jgi:hypothetical protein